MNSYPVIKISAGTIKNSLTRVKKMLLKEGYEGVDDENDIEGE